MEILGCEKKFHPSWWHCYYLGALLGLVPHQNWWRGVQHITVTHSNMGDRLSGSHYYLSMLCESGEKLDHVIIFHYIYALEINVNVEVKKNRWIGWLKLHKVILAPHWCYRGLFIKSSSSKFVELKLKLVHWEHFDVIIYFRLQTLNLQEPWSLSSQNSH